MGNFIECLELSLVKMPCALSSPAFILDEFYQSDIIMGKDFLKSFVLGSIFVSLEGKPYQIKPNSDIRLETLFDCYDENGEVYEKPIFYPDHYYRFYLSKEPNNVDKWFLVPTEKTEVKEVIKEVVKEVIKEVPVEVIKEVPVEKETIVEVPLINKNAYEEVEREPERTEEPVHRNHCIKSFSEKVFSDEYNYFTYPLMKITDREDKFKTVILNNNNSFSKVFEYALIPGVSKKYRIIIGDYMTKVEFDTISELKINYPDAYKKNLDQEYLYFYIPDEAARKLKINSNVSINLKGLENTLEAFEIKKKIYNL